MGRRELYREYDEDGELIKLECDTCHQIKSVKCFHKCKSKKDGVHTKCKNCIKNYQQEYCIINKEKIREQRKQYIKINKEKNN